MTYEQFKAKNDSNKERYDNACRCQFPDIHNLSPFTSSRIENYNKPSGMLILRSRVNFNETTRDIAGLISHIANDAYMHVSNPSAIKDWGFFERAIKIKRGK